MDREAFQQISRQRRREAAALLKAGHYPGAYYLVGYSIECALKACIAKQTKKHDFPDKQVAIAAWTHKLQQLIETAGLSQALDGEMKSNPALEINWTIVKDWAESSRYDLTITKVLATDLYSACTTRRNGILPWIRRRW